MERTNHPLRLVGKRVLEDWAMMLVDDASQDLSGFDREAPTFVSWVNIHGVVHGSLCIVAQQDFMQTLAENLLGSDPTGELGKDDWCDAFQEMSNVLAGNFLTEAYGDDTVFDLIHPHVREVSPEDFETLAKRSVVFSFLADEHRVAMTFTIDGAS